MTDSIQLHTAKSYGYAELFDTGQFDAFAAQFEHGVWRWCERQVLGDLYGDVSHHVR
jgi:hypothetical protein